jgi:hypothetical protein
MCLLIIGLDKDSFKGLLFACYVSIVVIVNSLDLTQAVVRVRAMEDTQSIIRRHHWHTDNSLIARNNILSISKHDDVEFEASSDSDVV